MSEAFDLTTYYAKRIIGDTAANTNGDALLQTGNNITSSMWILNQTKRFNDSTSKLYGIKYAYDSSGNDKIEYYGKNANDNATAWIQLNTGDASFNSILGKVEVNTVGIPESGTAYNFPYFVAGTTGPKALLTSGRLYLYEAQNSTYFCIGATDRTGGLTIRNANGKYADIVTSAFSANRTLTIPDQTGTIALLTKTDINALINLLDTGTSVLTAEDYIITQYVGGGTTTTTYHRRAAKNVRVGGLTTARSLWGNSFDGTADISGNITISGSTSNGMAAGSANPHITFIENGTTQPVHLIYTDLDSYRSPAGLKVVGGASATPAWFEVEGDIYFGGSGIYHVGTAKTQRIIHTIDANDQYGTGVSIGAGGLTILGSGESTNKMIDNLGYTGASEVTVISSDGIIGFYPSQNDAYDASSYIYMQQNKLMIGVNGNTTRESGLYVQSGAGQIELFSAASATGTRGLWVAAHGTGSSKTIISADTNNNITYAGGAISGSLTRAGVSKSWYQGRDSAIIKTTSYSGYDAILSMKTTAGDWALGVYTDNIMYFTYILDSNYSSNSNTVTKQFIFNPNGTLTATTFSGALSGNASTATKLSGTPNNTTTFLRGDNTWTSTINNTIICIPPTTNMASNNMAFNGGIQVRENGGVAANQSAIEYGPRISFHWSNRIAKSITLHSDGKFYFRDQNGTTRSTIDANLTGTADVASKLGTANVGGANRPIYLNAGTATAVSWYHNSCTISGGNTANYPWHRFAYCTTGTGNYTDKSVIVILHSRYDGGQYGMVKLSMRTNSAGASKSTSAVWIYRKGFAADDIKISAPTKTTGTDETISAYIKCGTYPRRIAYILEGSNLGWALVSSNEPNDTTTSDKKGGTEINASVSGNNATDGTTVSYLNCPRVTKNANEHPGKNITSMQEFSSTSTNLPSSHFYYILEAQGDDPAYSVQLAMGETASAIYYRAIQNNTYNSWNRLVTNSGSWSISVTGSSGSCTGNAATATTASYANVINNDGGRRASSEYMHADGKMRFYLATSSMTTGKPPTGDGFIIKGGWDNAGGWDAMISWSNSGHASVRGSSGSGNATNHTQSWNAWNTILDSNNYTSYTVTKTGSGASGSWGISVTGSSASCTGNSNTANYQNCVQTNEIRYARNGNMASANDLWQGWAFAEGKVAVINGWRFGNGNGALAPIYGSKIYNAIWNDFAEYRESDIFEGGRVLVSDGHGKLVLATERLQPAARVISDTFGCSVGQSDKAKTPIGVAGRVLVYPYQDRNNYKVGDCLCAAPNGTADIMTREEIINYPDRIIGIVDEIPTYEVWQQSLTNYKKKDNGEIDEIGEKNTTDTKVNGRIWIYVR